MPGKASRSRRAKQARNRPYAQPIEPLGSAKAVDPATLEKDDNELELEALLFGTKKPVKKANAKASVGAKLEDEPVEVDPGLGHLADNDVSCSPSLPLKTNDLLIRPFVRMACSSSSPTPPYQTPSPLPKTRSTSPSPTTKNPLLSIPNPSTSRTSPTATPTATLTLNPMHLPPPLLPHPPRYHRLLVPKRRNRRAESQLGSTRMTPTYKSPSPTTQGSGN
jgi:hypothetical protein